MVGRQLRKAVLVTNLTAGRRHCGSCRVARTRSQDQDQDRMASTWILVISELHRYQGVSYKSDITVISGQS